MTDPEVARIESAIRNLARDAAQAREDRADRDAAVANARETLERAKADLADADRLARERRLARHETLRGRADLERGRATILENEALARSRAERAEGLAHGYRSAAAFATIAASEAETAGAPAVAARERLVAERATRACADAESRAADARAEERTLATARAEVEVHLVAEREIEASLCSDRIDAERHATTLRERIDTAAAALRDAEASCAQADATTERIAAEANALRIRLRETTTNARGAIETRIADLRRIERDAAAERREHERTLATMIEDERLAAREAAAEPSAVPIETSPTHADASATTAAAHAATIAPLEPPALAPSNEAVEKPTALPTTAETERRNAKPDDDELIPGLIGLFGTIFSRRSLPDRAQQTPSPGESASVADRIARDFGWIGEPRADAPLREEVRDLEPERLGREGL